MTDTVVLQVEGMTCTGCEERIAKVLGRLDEVREARAGRSTGQVWVTFNPDRVAAGALAQLAAERIERAGYQVRSLSEEES